MSKKFEPDNDDFLLGLLKESQMMYSITKIMHPMNTKLDKNWRKIIKKADSQFMNDYDFFQLDTPYVDNKTVDGVLDWLYGQKILCLSDKEKKRICKIIDALDVSADYILRDEISSGKEYICMEITEKLLVLTPSQRKTATDILNAYLNNLL